MAGEYTTYDFDESLGRSEIKREDIQAVTYAWGSHGDYAEWSGGFILKLRNGKWARLTGWCDTTGWGCQDGIELTYFEVEPAGELGGDQNPTDLNRYLETGEGRFD